MRDIERVLHSLLSRLAEMSIPFLQVSGIEFREKAAVEFSFDLSVPPCILCGPFQDKDREVVSIAHEAGHVTVFRNMRREAARDYLCTMFAAHGVGLGGISPKGQECILNVEARASAIGRSMLEEIDIKNHDLKTVAALMSQWYTTYETLCRQNVVNKVRGRLLKDL